MAEEETGPASWAEYRRLVLSELQRINDSIEGCNSRLSKIELDIAMLKVKAGAWGALGGVTVALGAYLMTRLK